MRAVIVDPRVVCAWLVLDAISVGAVVWDLAVRNARLASVMKLVWVLTVLYSGPLGIAIYWFAGRSQIRTDSLWRKGFRSVAHCYSGCGAGEAVGLAIAAGLLSLGGWWITGITFLLAYAAGFALTVVPLMQDGEPLAQAVRDAVYSETASITVMEMVAIAVDFMLGGRATIREPIFWSAMIVSLSVGLVAAYPVNVALIAADVKEGMHDPRMSPAGGGASA